jgi:hypothetical protein
MIFLKKAGTWLIENPWAIITALASVFGAYLLYKSKTNKIKSLQDAVAVKTTLSKIAADEARADMLIETADGMESEALLLEGKIKASKRRVAELHEDTNLEGKSDEEIAALFGDSGL